MQCGIHDLFISVIDFVKFWILTTLRYANSLQNYLNYGLKIFQFYKITELKKKVALDYLLNSLIINIIKYNEMMKSNCYIILIYYSCLLYCIILKFLFFTDSTCRRDLITIPTYSNTLSLVIWAWVNPVCCISSPRKNVRVE